MDDNITNIIRTNEQKNFSQNKNISYSKNDFQYNPNYVPPQLNYNYQNNNSDNNTGYNTQNKNIYPGLQNNNYIYQTKYNIDSKIVDNNYSSNKENIYSTPENNSEFNPKTKEYNNIEPPDNSDFYNLSTNNINNTRYNSQANSNTYAGNTPQNKENKNLSNFNQDKVDNLENKTKIIPLQISNKNVSSSSQPNVLQNNRGVNTTENCCIRIDNSMTILTKCQLYTIIILSILLIISGILNSIICSIENTENILIIIAIDFELIVYSIFIIFSVLRIKWIRKTAAIFSVICFFGGNYGTYKQFEFAGGEKIHNIAFIFNLDLRFALLLAIMHYVLYGYYRINIFENCCK